MNELSRYAVVILLCLGWTGLAAAQTQPGAAGESTPSSATAGHDGLTTHEAVENALRYNPSFRAQLLATEQAAQRVRLEAGAFPWEFQADGGYTHAENPSLGPNESVVTSTNDTVSLGSQIEKTFPAGTGLRFRVQGDRYDTRRPSSSLATGDSSVSRGIGYEMSARATMTQPLLQGRGRRVNLANLRAARIGRVQAERAMEYQASALAADVLVAYWELWYSSRAVELERAALALAEQQHREAQARRMQGALAPVDVLTFETRVAELKEAVVSAEATERQRRVSLEQLIGGGRVGPLLSSPPGRMTVPTEAAVVKELEAGSPEIAQLKEQVRLAESNAEFAGESYRARLDLESYVEARGLGNERLPPAAEQVAGLDAVSGHVGLVYRTPLDQRRRDAARAGARLEVSIAKSNLESARQRLRADAATLVGNARSAEASLAAARQTVSIAERQFEAEKQRFAAGASTPMQVQEAEDALRQARHRVERARVTLLQTAVDLDHVTGTLRRTYAAAIAALE
jgi:outer membrane protein TolC